MQLEKNSIECDSTEQNGKEYNRKKFNIIERNITQNNVIEPQNCDFYGGRMCFYEFYCTLKKTTLPGP